MTKDPARLDELNALLACIRDEELDEAQMRQLAEILREDQHARRYYVEYIDMCATLRRQHGEVTAGVEPPKQWAEPESAITEPQTASPPMSGKVWEQRKTRSYIALCCAAVCILLCCAAWYAFVPNNGAPPGIATIPPPAPPETITVGQWRITPTGKANYKLLEPTLVRLDKGELFVESILENNDGKTDSKVNQTPLRIQTPHGEAVAQGTQFYIGTHSFESPEEDTMSSLTRVLVLTGAVALTTSIGTIEGTSGEMLAAESDQAPTKISVQANTDFAFDLYAQLASENKDENLFFSPYSISNALAMTAEGARGETAREIGLVLRFPEALRRKGGDAQLIPWETSMIHTGMAQLNQLLQGDGDRKQQALIKEAAKLRKELADHNERFHRHGNLDDHTKAERIAERINHITRQIRSFEINVANAIWGDKTFPFSRSYAATLRKHYGTDGIYHVDFRGDYATARQQINRWCAQQTKNRITEVMPPRSHEQARLLRMVLANAIYFKAEWEEPFEKRNTKTLPYMVAATREVDTAMMRSYGMESARYAAFEADGTNFDTPQMIRPGQQEGLYPDANGFAVLELAYQGDALAMVIVAPNKPNGLRAIESKLTTETVSNWIKHLKSRPTTVFLPKFKLATSYDLNTSLQALGMNTAFTPGADFSGLAEAGSEAEPLYLDSVRHKAFLEVNEEGTEAAAATTVVAQTTSDIPEDLVPFVPEFKADRPFIYFIREKSTGTVLFMGRVTNPNN